MGTRTCSPLTTGGPRGPGMAGVGQKSCEKAPISSFPENSPEIKGCSQGALATERENIWKTVDERKKGPAWNRVSSFIKKKKKKKETALRKGTLQPHVRTLSSDSLAPATDPARLRRKPRRKRAGMAAGRHVAARRRPHVRPRPAQKPHCVKLTHPHRTPARAARPTPQPPTSSRHKVGDLRAAAAAPGAAKLTGPRFKVLEPTGVGPASQDPTVELLPQRKPH